MKYLALIFLVFNFHSVFSQVKPPGHFIVHCDSIINSVNTQPLLKQYEITTYAFNNFLQFEKNKSPNHLVNEVDCIVAINIYIENHDEIGYVDLKKNTIIRLTFREISSDKFMNFYFRLCKPFMAGESIELSSFSFMQGDFFFDTYESSGNYKIKNWSNSLKAISKIENFCDDYGHFIFDISDLKKHKISEQKLNRVLKKCD